jgi:hypothetical protein
MMVKRSRLSRSGTKARSSRLKTAFLGITSGGWNANSTTYEHAGKTNTDYVWEKRGIDEGVMITLSDAWLGKPIMKEGYLVQLKKFTPAAGGHRTNIETVATRKSTEIETALKQAAGLMKLAEMKGTPKGAKFVWETPDKSWRWEATKYQGNGIFFGKVTSPYVPEGEWGTWYVWEVEENAKLVAGDRDALAKMKKNSERAQTLQKALLGGR